MPRLALPYPVPNDSTFYFALLHLICRYFFFLKGVEGHILKCALRIARTKYVSIPTLADCLSGLFR